MQVDSPKLCIVLYNIVCVHFQARIGDVGRHPHPSTGGLARSAMGGYLLAGQRDVFAHIPATSDVPIRLLRRAQSQRTRGSKLRQRDITLKRTVMSGEA